MSPTENWDPSPSSRFDAAETVKLLVGPDEHQMVAHKVFLTKNSDFFKAAMEKTWLEGQTRKVRLPEEQPKWMAQYLDFAYTGELSAELTSNTALMKDVYSALAELYTLGERLLDGGFKTSVLSQLVKILLMENKEGKRWFPGCDAVCIIYEGTTEASPARRLMVDTFVSWGDSAWLDTDAHPDFLLDLSASMMSKLDTLPGETSFRRKEVSPEYLQLAAWVAPPIRSELMRTVAVPKPSPTEQHPTTTTRSAVTIPYQRQKPTLPPSKFTTHDAVVLVVRPTKQEMLLHESHIAQSSGFFQSAMKAESIYGATRRIELPLERLDFMAYHLEFVYTHMLPDWVMERSEFHSYRIKYHRLAILYVIGERMRNAEIQNAIISEMLQCTHTTPTKSAIRIIYKGTAATSPARRLLVDWYVCLASAAFARSLDSDFHPVFLLDLSRKLIDRFDDKGVKEGQQFITDLCPWGYLTSTFD